MIYFFLNGFFASGLREFTSVEGEAIADFHGLDQFFCPNRGGIPQKTSGFSRARLAAPIYIYVKLADYRLFATYIKQYGEQHKKAPPVEGSTLIITKHPHNLYKISSLKKVVSL